MTDYKKYLHDRSAEFRDIEQPKAESYLQYKNRLALEAYRARQCGLAPEQRKSWIRRALGW
jgi:hypothetical protein